jgi:hypothetical protein
LSFFFSSMGDFSVLKVAMQRKERCEGVAPLISGEGIALNRDEPGTARHRRTTGAGPICSKLL